MLNADDAPDNPDGGVDVELDVGVENADLTLTAKH